MITSTLDVIVGLGSFVLPVLSKGLFGQKSQEGLKTMTETLSALVINASVTDTERLKMLLADKQAARGMVNELDMTTRTGSFTGITRRMLAWNFPFYLLLTFVLFFVLSALGHHGFNYAMPVTQQHSFLGIVHWTSTQVITLAGALWLPCFDQLLFMVFGFYFGFETMKRI